MISHIIPKLPFINKEETKIFYAQLGFDFVGDYGNYLMAHYNNHDLHFFDYPTLIPDQSDFMIYLKISNDIDEFYQQIKDKNIAIHPNGDLKN